LKSTELPDRYFASIRARDIDALMALYVQDAVFTLPDGREFSGTAAIREMHLSVFAAGAPIPTPVAAVVGNGAIAVEIEARLTDGTTRRTANFFHLDGAGLIRRLSVYGQGK
jgi:ketosteroid isomerase-like protein